MLGDIVTAFLYQPIDNDFSMLREAPQSAEQQPDANRVKAPKAIHQLPQSRSQTQLLQHGRAQCRDQAAHLQNGAFGEVTRFPQFSDPFGLFRRK